MRSRSIGLLLLLLLLNGCREEVVQELEEYGVKREWIPFADQFAGPTEKDYNNVAIDGASPWVFSRHITSSADASLSETKRSGKNALVINSPTSDGKPIYVYRYENVNDLLGHRVRFSGYIRAPKWNGTIEFGHRTTDAEGELIAQPVTASDTWTRFSTEVDVDPEYDKYLGFSLKLIGTGIAYVDDCSIEILGPSAKGSVVRSIPTFHANLGFEDGDLAWPSTGQLVDSLQLRTPYWRPWYSTDEYSITLDSSTPHTGKYAGGLRSVSKRLRNAGGLVYDIPAELLRAHHVRFSVWLKAKEMNGFTGIQANMRSENDFRYDYKRLWEVNGNTEWKQYSVELDIPVDAKDVRFDVWYQGHGTLLIDDLSVDKISRLPNTESYVDQSQFFAKPSNMDFESP